MKNVNQRLITQFGSRKLAENFYLSVTEFFYELDIDGQYFVDNFVDKYIEKVWGNAQTKGQVLMQTGFSEHYIRKHLSGDLAKSTNHEKNVYSIVLERIKTACLNSQNNIIPIRQTKGYSTSFGKIFNNSSNAGQMITSKALRESMITRGFLEIVDEKYIRFRTPIQTDYENTPEKIIHLFSDFVLRITGTLIHNMKTPNNSDKRYQLTYRSVHVPTTKHKQVGDEIRAVMRKAMDDCQKIVDSNEVTDDLAKRQVEALEHELGVSAFFFTNKI